MHKWSERNIVLAAVLLGEHERISSLCLCRFSADSNQRLIRLNLARSCSIGAAAAQAWPRICSCLFHLQFGFSYQRNFPPGLKSHVLIHRSTASPTKTRRSTVKVKSDKDTLVSRWHRAKRFWVLCDISEVPLISSIKNMLVGWMTKRPAGVSVSRWCVFSLRPQPINNRDVNTPEINAESTQKKNKPRCGALTG